MTLAQNWYDIKIALCSNFAGLDPIAMLDYPLVDVIDLIREQLEHNRRARTAAPTETAGAHNQERVIYRKADDSWF